LFRDDWVVYAKKPFGGPEHVLHYLARYTHRVAISNHRLVDVTDTQMSFRWKDYAHHSKRRIMTLTHEEFLRRPHPKISIQIPWVPIPSSDSIRTGPASRIPFPPSSFAEPLIDDVQEIVTPMNCG
jgi:hypothetical protein